MKPMPNNGTLRLPLETIGLHGPETILEDPEDSYINSTAEDVATAVMSISPVETSSASDVDEQPPTTVGVDPVEPSQDPEAPTEDTGDNSGDEPKEFKSWQDYWDWLTGKVDGIWHKLTGSEDKKSSD